MSLIPVKYPLDPTGTAASNKVTAEPHRLKAALNRCVVCNYGAFFYDQFAVTDAATGRVLTKNVDYYGTVLYGTPTEKYGKEIYQVIVIVDRTVGENVLFDYQALGGEFSFNWDAIVQLVERLNLDNRPAVFDAILGKPEAYPPAPHLHDAGDVYGFEYLVAVVERVVQAVQIGSAAGTKKIFDYIDGKVTEVKNDVEALAELQGSAAGIISSLGYTPINKGGDSFDGVVNFSKGISLSGYFKEKVIKLNATTNLTTLDLSAGSIFAVTMSASTSFVFDTTKMAALQADESLNFVLILINDATGGFAAAFPNNVSWAHKVIPPRSPGALARDEFYFSTFDSGASYTGSLSNADVG